MMTTYDLYLEMRKLLSKAGVEDAGFDADALLRHATGHSRFDAAEVHAEERDAALALAARRAKREPLQYILGSWPFLGLELLVGPGVLIPRPETEQVCLAAAEALRGEAEPRILDLCSGTGALALGLQSLLPAARVTAVEWDADAMAYLERNIAAFAGARPAAPAALRADALHYWQGLPPAALDLIVCNPPYVTGAEYAALAPELAFEPKQALVPAGGEADGLLFYRAIARAYRPALRPGGWLVFEIGAGQGPAVRAILEENAYAGAEIRPDMAGHDRITLARRP